MTLGHVLIVIFNETGQNYMILIIELIWICGFEISVGTGAAVHAQETALDSALGLGNFTLCSCLVVSSILTPYLIESTGVRGTFIFYGCVCLVNLTYIIIFLKDTTYKKDGSKLTEREKKELYMPEELK